MYIPLFKVRMSDEAIINVGNVLKSGYIGQGTIVDSFEKALNEYLECKSSVTVNSATSGLTLALRLLANEDNINNGDVLTVPITCTATNWAILAANYNIVWVDNNAEDCNMDLNDLRKKLSPRTKAIMVVHWGGYANDLNELKDIQKECFERFNVYPSIIEDAAHAFGSSYDNSKIGTHGNYCVFSFQAIKHLTTGDGGLLICPNEEQTHRAKLLRWYGLDRESSLDFRCSQNIQEWGYKFHMNDINASIGIANLKGIDIILSKHEDNANFYEKNLANVPGITLLKTLKNRRSVSWVFTFRAKNRDELKNYLQKQGIHSSQVHNRNDRHVCCKKYQTDSLPGTDTLSTEMLCIPCGWWVTEEDREYIVNTIKRGW